MFKLRQALKPLIKWLVEWKRKGRFENIEILNGALITERVAFNNSELFPDFLFLPPQTAAVLTTNSGKQRTFLYGGFVDWDEFGVLGLQYVDMHRRTMTLSDVQSESIKGSPVTLKVSIIYQVISPDGVLQIQKPMETLESSYRAAVINFIQTHDYEELVPTKDGRLIPERDFVTYIREWVKQNPVCSVFKIVNVNILNRQGDPQIKDINKERLLQESKTIAERESLEQRQMLTSPKESLMLLEAGLKQKRAEKEGDLAILQSRFSAQKDQILRAIKIRETRLRQQIDQPGFQQEFRLKALETIKEFSAQNMNGFPHNEQEKALYFDVIRYLTEGSQSSSQLLEPDDNREDHQKQGNTSLTILDGLIVPPDDD